MYKLSYRQWKQSKKFKNLIEVKSDLTKPVEEFNWRYKHV